MIDRRGVARLLMAASVGCILMVANPAGTWGQTPGVATPTTGPTDGSPARGPGPGAVLPAAPTATPAPTVIPPGPAARTVIGTAAGGQIPGPVAPPAAETAGAAPCLAVAPQGGSCTQPPGGWAIKSPLPVAVIGPAVASDGVYVYAAGGSDLSAPLNQFWRYDVVSDTWAALAPLPNPVHTALAVYAEGKIFVFGGQDATWLPTNTTQIYSIAGNSWSSGAPMPGPRSHLSGGYYAGNIYLAGGYTTGDVSSAQSQTWEYNISGNFWSSKSGMPAVVGGAGSGVVDGHLYVIGGRTVVSESLTSVYNFDIAGNSWGTAASMPLPANVPGAAVYGREIWVYGGGTPFAGRTTTAEAGTQSLSAAQIYDPALNSWTMGPSQIVPRSFQGGATVRNQIVSVGGYYTGALGTTEVATQHPLRILVVYSDADVLPNTLMTQMSMLPGVGQVDAFNAVAATPTVENLLAYDVVVPFTNSAWYDPAAMGDALASYLGAGGVVVAFNFSWASAFETSGKWLSLGYSPFNVSTSTSFTTDNLGGYSLGHPLMAGVTSLSATYRQPLVLSPGATRVASWTDGTPLIALKGNAVGVSAYVGDYVLSWSGDFAKVVVNAGYLLRHGNGPCLRLVCPGSFVLSGAILPDDLLQTGRLFRTGTASTCAGSPCPGPYNTNTVNYDVYRFVNNNGVDQCVTVSLSAPDCQSSNYVFSEAYLGTYDPGNLCTGYLGDLGGSPATTAAYSFTVPAWQYYEVAVNAVNPGARCTNYQLTVSASVCGSSAARQIFLPLVLRKVGAPVVLSNPGFENPTLAPWLLTGIAAKSSAWKTEGQYSALLGDPAAGVGGRCSNGGVIGRHGVAQTFTVPDAGSTVLSFDYQIVTQDSRQYANSDYLLVELNGVGEPAIGYTGPPKQCLGGENTLPGTFSADVLTRGLQRGDSLTLGVYVVVADAAYNTYAYIDNVRWGP